MPVPIDPKQLSDMKRFFFIAFLLMPALGVAQTLSPAATRAAFLTLIDRPRVPLTAEQKKLTEAEGDRKSVV